MIIGVVKKLKIIEIKGAADFIMLKISLLAFDLLSNLGEKLSNKLKSEEKNNDGQKAYEEIVVVSKLINTLKLAILTDQ
ncbi:hypothetical protein DICVIV_01488 [Dictyocaulus viviparus]|uniref:Uncharacterized protein n=1 Tax=Dictyocaulus viviparus TaxID=29172 RepID=A0A0D8YCJ0_DICVI|nr:hypothetical protein DICVIV_01488 [Dictyocaulus viviparus]